MLQQVQGGIHEPLRRILAVLAAPEKLRFVGLHTDLREQLLRLGKDHCVVQEDSKLAAFAAQWALGLVSRRARRMLWLTRGWCPSRDSACCLSQCAVPGAGKSLGKQRSL